MENRDFLGALGLQAGKVLLLKIVGAFVTLGVQLMLARLLGAQQYGIYAYALFWILIILLPAKLGMEIAILRFVAAYRAKEQWELLHGIIRTSLGLVFLSSVVFSFLIFMFFLLLGHHFPADLRNTFWIACTVLPILALFDLSNTILRAFEYAVKGSFLGLLFQPTLFAILIGISIFVIKIGLNATLAMALHLTASLGGLLLSAYWCKRVIAHTTQKATPKMELRTWISTALPMMLLEGFAEVHAKTDMIMIGLLIGTTPAGIYSIALRWSILIRWGLFSINTVIAPVISAKFVKGEIQELQKLLSQAALATSAFAVPTILVIIFAGKQILAFFGADFPVGYYAMVILAFGGGIYAVSGCVGFLLPMTGHHKESALTMGLVAAINIPLNLIFIKSWGLSGAAAATLISIIIWNISMFRLARKYLNINPTLIGLLRKP